MTRWSLALVSLAPSTAAAAEPYCVDNPAVIYCNDFEDSLDGIEAGARATIVSAASGAPTHDGDGSLFADFTPPYGAEAEFSVRFASVDRVYARFYMRFDDSWTEPMHHFYAIHGDRDDDQWSCHGDAGCRPDGVQCLSGTTVDTRVTVDGELPGQPFFYTYHPEMTCDPGDSCANYADPQAICDGCAERGLPCEMGLECCWGEHLEIADPSISLVADTWYAVETMVVANTPGVADGEMTLWIDGAEVGHHEGIAWRDDPTLQLNHFIVWNYYPESAAAHRIWFDDLVISTAPIGVHGGGTSDTSGGMAEDASGDVTTAMGEGGTTSNTTTSTGGGPTTTAADGTGGESTGAAASDGAGGCGCNGGGTTVGFAWLVVLGMLTRRRHGATTARARAGTRHANPAPITANPNIA